MSLDANNQTLTYSLNLVAPSVEALQLDECSGLQSGQTTRSQRRLPNLCAERSEMPTNPISSTRYRGGTTEGYISSQ